MAGIRDFFYVLTHYKEISDELDRANRQADEIMEIIEETNLKQVFFIKSMYEGVRGNDIKICVHRN